MYKFVSNKSFGQLLDISPKNNKSFGQLQDIFPKNFVFSKTFNSKLSYTEVWFTDQNFKPLEIEDKITITLVIN